MKKLTLIITCLTLIILFSGCSSKSGSGKYPDNPYLGQTPPDLIPLFFASGLISTQADNERDITFSTDLKEIYFSRDGDIYQVKYIDGKWGIPLVWPYNTEFNEIEPYISSDNKRMYFVSNRPMREGDESNLARIWYVERENKGWSEPLLFMEMEAYYPTISDLGWMYFTGGDEDIYKVDLNKRGGFSPVPLGSPVNTGQSEYNSYIAPDESYLIFTSTGQGEGYGSGDLWISFKNETGEWDKPRNLGPGINTIAHEYCPMISPDGKYLFFTSNRVGTNDIYWISSEIIDYVRKNDFNLPERIYSRILDEGVEAGIREYLQIRQDYLNFAEYNGSILVGLCDRLTTAGKTQEAIALYDECFKLYPNTSTMKQNLKRNLLAGDQKAVDEFFETMKSAPNLSIRDENEINQMGYFYLGAGYVSQAQLLFRKNMEIFPGSGNVYDSYAESLLAAGDTAGAKKYYRKSLEKDPQNQNAIDVLNNLK